MLHRERSRAALLVAALLAMLPLLTRAADVPWTFTAGFASGYNGWMSYPLPQDIGYDPSLFTDAGAGPHGHTVALVRQVESHGEARLALGVIRPLPFRAGAAARLHLVYRLRLHAPLTHWHLIFAAHNGRRYTLPLPATPGLHTVDVTGTQLGLPAAGTEMQAVVLEGWLDHPAAGSRNRMDLQQFVLQAERPAAVKVLAPALESAPDGRRPDGQRLVAAAIVRTGAEGDGVLHFTVAPSPAPLRVVLTAPDGRPGPKQSLAASPAHPVEVSLHLGPEAGHGLWTAEATRGAAQTRFQFLVLGRVSAHPRLLLSSARWQQLESEPEYGAFRAQVHQQAQAHAARIAFNVEAGHNIAMMPTGEGIGPSYPSELVPYFALMDGYADAIADSALDYRLNHDAKALAAARRGLLTVAHWQTWTPPRFSHHGMHTYYEVGLFAQRVAFGYDLIAPELTPEERATVAEALWNKAIEPTVCEYFLHNRMPLAASNWMANSLGGALAATVATLGDDPALQPREETALAELTAAYQQNLAGLFSGDGSEMEPAGYENFAMKGIAWGMSALQAVGIRPVGTTAMLDGFWWLDYAMVRPDLVLDTGDFDGELKAIPGFAWGAEYGGIPALRSFYRRITKPLALPPAVRLQDTGRRLEDMPGLLNLICCTPSAATSKGQTVDPPLSRLFAKRGSAVLRSGWGGDATVISLRAGPWFNHEHHDQGSFQVAALGDSLIADAGYADYYRDPNYPTYFTQANGHNTILLDGDGFSQGETQGRFWAALSHGPHFTAHLLSPQVDYLAADLAPAYEGRLAGYQRQFLFLAPGVLLVRDVLHAPAPHGYSWLLHTAPGLTPVIEGNRAELHAAHAWATVTAHDASLTWKGQTTPIAINAFRDLDHNVIAGRSVMQLTRPRAKEASFLVALQFEPRGTAAPKLTSLTTANSSGFAAADGSWMAVFRTAPGTLSAGRLTTNGSVLAQHGAGWLAAGATWLQDGATRRISTTHPVDLACVPASGGLRLDLHAQASVDLQVQAGFRPSRVELDGHPAAFTLQNGSIMLKNISQGDHRVWIAGNQLP